MKKFAKILLNISAFSIFSFSANTASATYIGGVLSSDTTLLLVNSPYIVTNNLLVQQGVKVIVEAGVVFLFNQDIYLQVDGEFRAIGTDSNKIIFAQDSLFGATSWGGIHFTDLSIDYNKSDGSGCILSYFGMKHGKIEITNCSPIISNSEIKISDGMAIVVSGKYASPEIFGNYIHNGGAFSEDDGWGFFHDNEISHCAGAPAIFLQKSIFTNNYIHDCSGYVLVSYDTSIICNNLFSHNTNAYFVLGIISGDAHIIKCNTFVDNNTNLVVTCVRHPILINNNFFNYQDWNVYWTEYYFPFIPNDCPEPSGSGVYDSIDLSNNYWGGLTNSEMDNSIWDYNDDFSLKAMVIYSPTFPDSIIFSTVDCSQDIYTGNNEALISDDNNIQIYPNPFHDFSYLKIRNQILGEKYEVYILNTYGSVVKKINVTDPGKIEIARGDLPAGLYAYQIISPQKKTYSGKFIIE